ncbi:hypothetical protein DFH27DRAFT_473892, partial [Peziza echinospora]
MHFTAFTLISALVATVSSHGNIISHNIRQPADTFAVICGQTAYDLLRQDIHRSHQNLIDAVPSDPSFDRARNCNFFLCKGIPFIDNLENVYQFRPNEVIDIEYLITIPHDGVANMSVVDTYTNRMIGRPLLSFSAFGSTPDNLAETNFNFRMSNVGTRCKEQGRCVLQFWWHSDSAAQTYASCIDF